MAWHRLERRPEAIERYLAAAAAAGASLEEAELPASFDRLLEAQQTIHWPRRRTPSVTRPIATAMR